MHVLTAEHEVEIDRIKGSRFIGHAAPVPDEAGADAFVAAIRALYPDATHHCWAWRLRDDRFRYADAGEPGGTAGRPIHAAIVGRDLADVVVVVVRYFGGTKLGMGGLVKAYGAAAAAVLDAAPSEPYVARRTLVLRFGYPDQGAVRSVLHALELSEDEAVYTDDVVLTVTVREELADELLSRLGERTAGRLQAD